MIMLADIGIEMDRSVSDFNGPDFSDVLHKHKIPVDCSKAYLWIILADAFVDHVSRRVILAVFDIVPDGGPLSAVFECHKPPLNQ